MSANGAKLDPVARTEEAILYHVVITPHRSAGLLVPHGGRPQIPASDPKFLEALVWLVADLRQKMGGYPSTLLNTLASDQTGLSPAPTGSARRAVRCKLPLS